MTYADANLIGRRHVSITFGGLYGGAFNETTGALLAGAQSLTITLGPGDFTWNRPAQPFVLVKPRGVITDPPLFLPTDDVECTWSFSAYLRDLGETTYATLEQIVNGTGYAIDNWESVGASSAGCNDELWLVGMRADFVKCAAQDYSLLFPVNSVGGGGAVADPSTLSVAGTCFRSSPILIRN